MFNARAFIDSAATELGLPDGYNTGPLEDLISRAYFAGADAGSDAGADALQGLIAALETIIKTSTDPVAKSAAKRAIEAFEGMKEHE